MIKVENVISSLDDFPTLPTVYTKLINSISNPRSTVQDVADIIIKDQATTVKLLKLANSPLYAMHNKVTNVTQAIFYLGFNEVKNLVLSLSIMDLFKKVDDKGSNYLLELWKHSVAVGSISKILGVKLGINNTEDYFVSGIIHDIGVLFLFFKYRDIYIDLIEKSKQNNVSIEILEKETFGLSHYLIGELIVEKWKLPLHFKNVVKNYNNGLVDGKVDDLIAVIHLSNIISKLVGLHFTKDPIVPMPNFQIWSRMHFDKDVLNSLLPLIYDTYNASINILKLDK